jgi:hypothetical protein
MTMRHHIRQWGSELLSNTFARFVLSILVFLIALTIANYAQPFLPTGFFYERQRIPSIPTAVIRFLVEFIGLLIGSLLGIIILASFVSAILHLFLLVPSKVYRIVKERLSSLRARIPPISRKQSAWFIAMASFVSAILHLFLLVPSKVYRIVKERLSSLDASISSLHARIPPISRKQSAWFILTAVMFCIAGLLTYRVTEVGGQSPIASLEAGREADSKSLFISIMTPDLPTSFAYPKSPDVLPVGITFFQRYDILGTINKVEITFPSKMIVVMNQLGSADDCVDKPERDSFGRAPQHIIVNSINSRGLYGIYPTNDAPDHMVVTCDMKQQLSNEYTFTTKELSIAFFKDAGTHYNSNDSNSYEHLLEESCNCAPKYLPVEKILANFGGIVGAERFSFDAGYQDQELSNYESKRYITPGTWLNTHWIDVQREGLRDILLVVIGTLIGIGCTMFIEGLRPFVEEWGSDAAK